MTTPHLDDERLSAHLDGEEPDAAPHLASCDSCRARLDALRAVAAAVGAPVAPPASDRGDAAVARALASVTAGGEGSDVGPPVRRRPPVPFALGAAALVLVVLVAVSVLAKDDGGDNRAALTSDDSAEVAAGAGGSAVPHGGDLGDQNDPSALADRLRAVLEPPAADAATTGGGSAALSAPNSAEAKAEAQLDRRGSGGAVSAPADCTAAVAREYGAGLGPLAYRATLRWDGTPAVVLVYPIVGAGGGLDRRVLVMAQQDCRLLVAQTI